MTINDAHVFSGRHALITGAASGIGLACAHYLSKRGVAGLVLVDIDADGLDAARIALQRDALSIICAPGDASDPDYWDEISPMLVDVTLGIANAGVAGFGGIDTMPFAEWRRIMAVNSDALFLTLQATMRAMISHGHGGAIVITASATGLKAEKGTAAYGASKAAALHLARIAAKEGAEHQIRVNAIAPGGVETPIWEGTSFFAQLVEKTGSAQGAYTALASDTPLGRFARSEEIAAQIGFLLSPAAATITGTTLISDGGYLL